MFGTLGGPELLLILVIALIVFGPRKLPEIGKSMGKLMAEFRRASNDFKRTIEDEVDAEKIRDKERIVAEHEAKVAAAGEAAAQPALPAAPATEPPADAITPHDHAPAAAAPSHEAGAPSEPK